MSTKIDPKENVRFLVSCIAHSSNGKPNFELVAKELDIVSKGAASKRYERLLKSCGVTPGGKSTAAAAADEGDEEETAKPAAKKRKAPAPLKTPAVKKIKAAPRSKKTQVKTEEEEEGAAEDQEAKAESETSLSGTVAT